VLPLDLRERLAVARRSIDLQPPALNQHVLAAFIAGGHYDAHLRDMRAVYRERLDTLLDAAERYCGGVLKPRPVITGLHAVCDLAGVPDRAVSEAAAARGLEVTALSSYYRTEAAPNGLVLGFGAVPPAEIVRGMQQLAIVLDRVRATGAAAAAPS
jgi:GntR family transcriptional regulator / MocR family aminotransferase